MEESKSREVVLVEENAKVIEAGEEPVKNPTTVEKSSEEPVEEEDSLERLKERVREAVQGGCDLQARFTVDALCMARVNTSPSRVQTL